MVVIDRVYADNAVQTRVVGSLTPTVPGAGGTFTVQDATGYPASGKFPVKLNRTFDDEEHILISSRVGNVFTVSERGYGGTSAQAHSAPTCEIYFDAPSANRMVDHVDGTEVDPHSTTLLNNARHDITARHTYGAALGTRPVPVAVGTSLSAGSASAPAAGDHQHVVGVGAINNANMFAAGVVDAAAIGADQVGTSEIAPNAVTTAEILDGTILLADLAASLQAFLLPTGAILPYGAAAAPTGFVLADGAAISRATFSALFAVIGTTYGVGDGSTTFNVPDLRQRFPLGKTAAGTGSLLGGVGGAIDHVHALDSSSSGALVTVAAIANSALKILRKTVAGWTDTHVSTTTTATTESAAQTTGAQLIGNTDTANPPFQTVQYIVKT